MSGFQPPFGQPQQQQQPGFGFSAPGVSVSFQGFQQPQQQQGFGQPTFQPQQGFGGQQPTFQPGQPQQGFGGQPTFQPSQPQGFGQPTFQPQQGFGQPTFQPQQQQPTFQPQQQQPTFQPQQPQQQGFGQPTFQLQQGGFGQPTFQPQQGFGFPQQGVIITQQPNFQPQQEFGQPTFQPEGHHHGHHHHHSSNGQNNSNGNPEYFTQLPHMVKRSEKIGRDHHNGSQFFDQFFQSNLKNEFHTPEADSITVYHTNNIVVGLEVHYKCLGKDSVATLVNRGTHNGNVSSSYIKLEFGEHFTEISGRAGDSIDRLLIKTSRNRSIEVGGTGGQPFGNLLPFGNPQIVGFGGSTRDFLDSLYVLHK